MKHSRDDNGWKEGNLVVNGTVEKLQTTHNKKSIRIDVITTPFSSLDRCKLLSNHVLVDSTCGRIERTRYTSTSPEGREVGISIQAQKQL